MKLPHRIYHLAEASNWPRIQRDGLLSASRLLTAAGIAGVERTQLERAQRERHTVLPSGVEIRDQRPMPPAALAKCLCGMSPAEWYAAINARVFFWVGPERLNRQRAACAERPQVVMAIDTAALMAAHGDRAAVTAINTGNARRRPARRGAATFVPVAEWLSSAWSSEAAALGIPTRPTSHRPVEVTVLDAVPDIARYTVDVVELACDEAFVPSAASDTAVGDRAYTIALAERRDLAALSAIERSAAAMLTGHAPQSVLDEATSIGELNDAQVAGHLWVARAGDTPVGFALVEMLAPDLPHLDEIDVHPDHGRRGVGAALVRAVCDWARRAGHRELTLTTFRAVPWNAPFYARLGFEEIPAAELRPQLSAIIDDETARGLDPRRRVAMRIVLG